MEMKSILNLSRRNSESGLDIPDSAGSRKPTRASIPHHVSVGDGSGSSSDDSSSQADSDSGSGSGSGSGSSDTGGGDLDEIEEIVPAQRQQRRTTKSPQRPNEFGEYRSFEDIRKDDEKRKRVLIYELHRLKMRGRKLPGEMTMKDSLDDIQAVYDMVKRDNKIDEILEFEKQVIRMVTVGAENANRAFNPWQFNLDGWSGLVSTELNEASYENPLYEIAEKHEASGGALMFPPEVRLLIVLVMSAVSFHMASSKQQSVPKDVNDVINSDPELRRKFEETAKLQNFKARPANGGAGMGDLFGTLAPMLGSMMNNINNNPSQAPPPPPSSASRYGPPPPRAPPPRPTIVQRPPQPQRQMASPPGGVLDDIESVISETLSDSPQQQQARRQQPQRRQSQGRPNRAASNLTVSDGDVMQLLNNPIDLSSFNV